MTKIMLIEDNPEIVKELKMHLGYLYVDVISVMNSGEQALKTLKKASNEDIKGYDLSESEAVIPTDFTPISNINGELPDIILMDIALSLGTPLLNATETAKSIRMSWQIPIIFIVGHTDEEFIYNVELDFPFGYILTPISTRELKVTIDVALYTAKIEAERSKALSELRKSDERYKALVDNMVSGVAIYKVVKNGEDFIFLDVNKAAERIDGQTREELIGRSIFDARPGISEFGLIDTFKKVIKTGKPQHHPIKLYKDDRINKYYDNYVYQLSSGEIVAIFRDETLKKQSEDDMKKLEAQLNQAQKMEAIGTMAGGIAHDFNNILFPILGCAEMLIEDSPKESSQREFLNEILKAGHRAKELVRQILTFSRQEQHEVMPLSIQPIAKEIIKLSRAMIPSTIKINQDIARTCCMVMADPTQMHQVLMNLITNAFHAMEDTGGTLTVKIYETQKVVADTNNSYTTTVFTQSTPLSKQANGKYLCIEVSDTGVGIEESIRNRIFEPYFTTKEQGKGTGLGLAVVHGIVKSCKGDIVVTSEAGQGTSFKIYLPGIEPQKFNLTESLPLKKHTGNETIMVVDDEPVVAKMLGTILERSGYKVSIQTDSLEALQVFKEKPDMYDLIITDLTMPGLTGEKLSTALKVVNPSIPVILCTGFSAKGADLEKSGSGIDRVVMKPIISQNLLKTVRELLD
ncbi:MAG: response regulator [Desulfamplus sp.]|nr:response regulator [Desulfamplus sp.]